MKHKLLSILLCLAMALSLLPTAALADGENVAKVGETEYATLAEAVTAAKEAAKTDEIHSATITLLKNTELAAEVKLDGNDSVVNENPLDINIDLNNCTLDMKSFKVIIENGAVLEIFNGQISSTPEKNNNPAFRVNAESSCLLDNVTMTTTGVAVFAQGDCALAAVNNSNITAGTYAVTTNAASSDNYNPVFNIVDSTLKGSSPVLVNVPCELNIKNSTINGSMHGVIVRGGTANITGSTITQTYTDDDYQEMADYFNNRNWGSGNMINLGALIVGNKHATSYQYHSDVTVTDTVIKTAGAHADLFPAIYTYANNAADKGVNLSIGGDKTNVSGKVVKGNEEYNTISISGGAFTDIANAVKYAADGATIKLAGDVTRDSGMIEVRKPLTVDLNTHKLTSLGGFDIYADLTVKNGQMETVGWAAWVQNGAKLVVDKDVTIKATSSEGNKGGITVQNNGSAVTIYGSVEAAGGAAVSGIGNKEDGGVTINIEDGAVIKNTNESGVGIYYPNTAELNIKGGTITGATGVYVKSGKTTITGGVINGTGAKKDYEYYGNGAVTTGDAFVVDKCNYPGGDPTVEISGGFFNSANAASIGSYVGNGATGLVTGFITGGYFTSDPTAYLAAGKYVIKSDKAGYTYAVTGTKPEKTPIFVDENTTHDTSAITDGTTKSAIDAVINKAKVEGVAAAVDESALVASKVDASEVDAAKKVEVEVSVKVEVKSADLSGENAAKTLTFEAKPVATIKVDGNVRATNVAVPNSLLSGDITVKLPLPEGFTPEQIKHISSDRSVEYFLRTAKSGAKTFEIKDGCAVFTITKFSTFELSGTVTYVEPSYSSGGSSDPTYSVSTPSKTEHGTVTVSPKSASKGDRVTVTVKPDSGYVLETLTVTDKNGNELTLKDKGNGKYTFTMPAGKVEVKATFMEDNSMLNFFYDVPNNAYFYEAVKWAVENGITTGVGNDLFAPEQPCTRAQIVTFLWRAAGSPEPKGAASGMTDVVSGSYYEKAVAWAIENGITTGTTTTTFSPDVTCTRAQAVTFLARALKAKAASAAEFSDVPTGSYFADAVAWAAANGVTEGIGGGLFGSDNDCTRGQIVTFLYRAYNK